MNARLSAAKRGYGRRWRKVRAGFLRAHPLCARCERAGRVVEATVVDHIEPHRGDRRKFWDPANWQSLCAPCHDGAKQAEERRGYSKEIGANGWPVDPRHPANAASMGTG